MSALEELQSLEGHADRVWSVAWSPQGDKLASCSGDKTVRIWELQFPGGQTWICSAVLESHARTVRSCCWSPSGMHLATASFDATTCIWECQRGVWEEVTTLEGHENEVKSVAWHPDGSLLATCSRDKSVWIWESLPGDEFECVDVKQGHTQDVKMVAWHPKGQVLVSASYDDSIKLWVDSGDEWICAQTLSGPGLGHSSTVWGVTFCKDGSHMASCSDDLTIKIWKCGKSPTSGTSLGDPLNSYRLKSGPSQGGSASTASCTYNPCCLWKRAPRFVLGDPLWKLATSLSGFHERTVFSIDWARDGHLATGSGDNTIRIFSPSQEADTSGEAQSLQQLNFKLAVKRVGAHDADVNCVQWHPKQAGLLASAGDDGLVKLWRFHGLGLWTLT